MDKPPFVVSVTDEERDAIRKKTRAEIIDLIKHMRKTNPETMGDDYGFKPEHISDVLDVCHDEALASFLATFVGLWSRTHPTSYIINTLAANIKGDE